jgi:hypothetical protein
MRQSLGNNIQLGARARTMRTRFPQPLCTKGSQCWVQLLVNKHQSVLEEAIGVGPITWGSPLENDEYAEYRDQPAFDRIDAKPTKCPLSRFWPSGGPQWDALGRAQSSELIIVEAKAHIPEMFSNRTGAAGPSLNQIRKSLRKTKKGMRARPGLDWSERFYQYANRLAHAYWLQKVNGLPTRLVFLHFIGDAEMDGPETRASWEAAIEVAHEALGLRGRVPRYVQDAFIDVSRTPPVVA